MAARAWRRSAASPRAWAATAAAAVVAAAAAAGAPRARAFSTFAGSCEHAGVVHGLDPVHEAQGGSGGHAVTLAGEIVAGEKVGVTLSGEKPYKGLNLYAVDPSSGDVIGEFEDFTDATQSHPDCNGRVTHTGEHTVGLTSDTVTWAAPPELEVGDEVIFMATVVRQYDTWFAFESEPFRVARVGAHAADLRKAGLATKGDAHAPGVHAPGTHAPGVHAPGTHAPGTHAAAKKVGAGTAHAPEVKAPRVVKRQVDGRVGTDEAGPIAATVMPALSREAALRAGGLWVASAVAVGAAAPTMRRALVSQRVAAVARGPALAVPGVLAVAAALVAYADGSLFSLHPIAMSTAYTLAMAEGARAASAAVQLPPGAERLAVLKRHGWLQLASFVCAAAGFWAIYTNKDRMGKPHITSVHAVVGVGALSGTALNALLGVLAFKHLGFIDMLPRRWHAALKRFHRALGLATLLVGLVAVYLGARSFRKGGALSSYAQPAFAGAAAVAAVVRAGPAIAQATGLYAPGKQSV